MLYQSDARNFIEALSAAQAIGRPDPIESERSAADEAHAGRIIAETVPSAEDRIETAYQRDLKKLNRFRICGIHLERHMRVSDSYGLRTNTMITIVRKNALGEHIHNLYELNPYSGGKISHASVLRAKRAQLLLLERARANQ